MLVESILDITACWHPQPRRIRNILLGTEYLNGRPALHLQFNETVEGKGDMVTHLWMDKDTWMLLATEWYNADGEPARRRVVREVRLNQGLADTLF